MNSIDIIISRIISDAEEYADAVSRDCDTRCNEILEDAKARAREIYLSFKRKGDAECAEMIKRTSASAATVSKNILLETKTKKLDEIFKKAEKRISNLPPNEYYQFLFNAIKKAIGLLGENGICTLQLNSRDRENYGSKILSEMKTDGKDIVFGDDISSLFGFIVSRDGTDINSSSDTVISEARQRLEHNVCEILFE